MASSFLYMISKIKLFLHVFQNISNWRMKHANFIQFSNELMSYSHGSPWSRLLSNFIESLFLLIVPLLKIFLQQLETLNALLNL